MGTSVKMIEHHYGHMDTWTHGHMETFQNE
jgi:hypothetical protein